jgi:DnaJ family protein C protein 30
VLGNYRLRKLYDRGIIHTAGKDFSHHAAPEAKTQAYDDMADQPHDDPTTKFYKSRLRRQQTTSTGEKIYDFDAWTANHYSETFKNSTKGRTRYNIKKDRNAEYASSKLSYDMTIGFFVLVACFFVIAEFSVHGSLKHLDRVSDKNKNETEEKKKE